MQRTEKITWRPPSRNLFLGKTSFAYGPSLKAHSLQFVFKLRPEKSAHRISLKQWVKRWRFTPVICSFLDFSRGIKNPTKKYGNNEIIYLPRTRSVISFQKWSFDIPREQKYLKTDVGALRLISIHCVEDIRSGRIKPRPEHLALIEEYRSPDFPCDKQYVELCQKMFGYGYVYLDDCTVKIDLMVKDVRLNEGMKVDLIEEV